MSESRLYTPPDESVPTGYKLFSPRQLLVDLPTYTQMILELQALRDAEKERFLAIGAKAEEAEKGFDDALYELGDERRAKQPASTRKKPDGLTMPIFDISAVEKRLQYDPTSTGDRDERRVRNLRLEMIFDSGAKRKLGQVQVDTEARLDSLAVDFPNFAEVISYLRGVVAIAHADDRTAQSAHILLNGPPGIGKTLFSQCIPNILGTELHGAHSETMQTSSDLVGNSYTYSNACTALIFNTLIEGEYANRLILLDEPRRWVETK